MKEIRNVQKKPILILSNKKLPNDLETILENLYRLDYVKTEKHCLDYLFGKYLLTSALMVDIDIIRNNNYKFVEMLSKNPLYVSIPIIAITEKQIYEENLELLKHGVSDIICKPYLPLLIERRIDTAIRAKDSLSFHEIEKILRRLPSNICLKDAEGRYIFTTHLWHHFEGIDEPGFTIRGKTDIEVRKDKLNAMKAVESDKEVIATGHGTKYIIQEDTDGELKYYELIKEPTFDGEGNANGIVMLINDITEEQILKKELEWRSTTDQLTNIFNRQTTVERIDRALKEENEGKYSALLMLDVDKFKEINDTYGHAAGDEVLATIGRIIKDSIKGMDIAGRLGGDEFVIFLKEINKKSDIDCFVNKLVTKIKNHIYGKNPEIKVSLSIGVSFYPNNGTNFAELYRSADSALYEVKENGRDSCKII